MKSPVEFQTTPSNPIAQTKVAGPTYRDETYIPTHRGIQLKFKNKITWLRFLPGIRGSEYGWIMPFKRFHDNEGRFPTFVDPASLGHPSVFQQALNWFRANDKEALYNKANPRGFRFYPQERCLAWAIDNEAPDGQKIRLFNSSMYDGVRGGSPGLGHQLYTEAVSVDSEPGSATLGAKIYGDISDPQEGRLVGIEKSTPQSGDNQFASYSVRIGKSVSALDLSKFGEEVDLIKPLEQVLHVPTEEEQKSYLKAYIGSERYAKIFP